MLQNKPAFYKPRIPRLELKIPTISFPDFFKTYPGNNVTKNMPKTVTTKLPSAVSGLTAGYTSAELVDMVELDSGNQGLRMATSGAIGFLTGGPSGAIEGIIGSMISSVSNPGSRNPIDEIKPRKTGEIWNDIFSELPSKTQKWITSEPTLPKEQSNTDKYFDDLILRTRTVAGLRNEIDKKFQKFITGDESVHENSITSTELDESIKRIEDVKKTMGGSTLIRENALVGLDLSITPPIKSSDGWLYLEETEGVPSLDNSIIKNYSYEKYLEAIA